MTDLLSGKHDSKSFILEELVVCYLSDFFFTNMYHHICIDRAVKLEKGNFRSSIIWKKPVKIERHRTIRGPLVNAYSCNILK